MLFNSIEYLLFLPIVFALYWLLRKNLKLQNLFVVLASYVFYGWWDWRFLILIAFTSFCSWGSGLVIAKSQTRTAAKAWTAANIVLNLTILAIFKYYDFFVSEFGQLFGISIENLLLSIILPVGISFYTFQALSYSTDVYRKKIEPTRDIVAFFAYVAFFPQLVAGPIERATNLLPQFMQKRAFSYEQGIDGIRQILWGLFKKIVVADNCAMYVDQVWSTYDTQNGSTLLLATVLFTFQIYGDFSGYSDIAIGTAKLFGIKLMRNFNNPYFSRDIAEFWRRWHISLTTWFRDYVYIPLGGSRPEIPVNIKNPDRYKKSRIENTPNYQGNAVINYTSHDVPYTRVIEHKHFEMFGQAVYDCPKTVVSEEYSTEYKPGMEQFYPVNDERNNALADQYRELAVKEENVIFGGRLAEYKYYDMAPIIEKVLKMEI